MRSSRLVAAGLLVVTVASCSTGAATVRVGQEVATNPSTTAPTASTTTTAGATSSTAGPTTTASGPGTTGDSSGFTPQPITWAACGKLQCGRLTVPLDWSKPTGATISLKVERQRATNQSQRIGSMLINPGGPGVAGTTLVEEASLVYSAQLMARFDLVAWDPRGTGASSPVKCVDNLDPYFSDDPTVTTPEGLAHSQQLVDEFNQACEKRSGTILPFISTVDTARDMNAIREALGEDKITYFGFSYGTKLGATWATLFPSAVRAAVLDGAYDPNQSWEDSAKEQAVGIERAFTNAMKACAGDASCPINNGGDPTAKYDQLWNLVATNPIPVSADRPKVSRGVMLYGVIQTLYDDSLWSGLYDAVAAGLKGDGKPMLDLYDNYLERNPDGSWNNTFEALTAINCLDEPGPTDKATLQRVSAELQKLAPHIGGVGNSINPCATWPAKPAPTIAVNGKGAGPILVVGNTGDPVTPIESSSKLATSLEHGVLLTYQGQGHTSYGRSRCVISTVDAYLINLTVPAAGTTCS